MEDHSETNLYPPPPLPIPEPPTKTPLKKSWRIKKKTCAIKIKFVKKKTRKRIKPKKWKKNKKVIIKIASNKKHDPNPDPITEMLTNGVFFN